MCLTLDEMTPRFNGILVLLLKGRGHGSSEIDEETETGVEGKGGYRKNYGGLLLLLRMRI